MRPKGSPKTPGSGRKKGTVNKINGLAKEKAQELDIDPFEVLLLFAGGDWSKLGYESEKDFSGKYTIEPQVRMRAAGDACQFIYPKLKQIEAKINGILDTEDPCPNMTDEELEKYDIS